MMDPKVTLRELLAAVIAKDFDHARELAEALDTWLRRDGFSPLPIPDTAYQGWKNYETWAVHLYLTGDQDTDKFCIALTRRAVATAATCVQVVKGNWTVDHARRHLLAESLKEFVDVRSPLADEASIYSDLLGCALYEVDWNEIADALLERGMP
ncbi:MAG: hypothetical protein K8T89_07085 [Planctomycetes bacterium]|nr:hypothetical protein [Planctomycetota bacterium]